MRLVRHVLVRIVVKEQTVLVIFSTAAGVVIVIITVIIGVLVAIGFTFVGCFLRRTAPMNVIVDWSASQRYRVGNQRVAYCVHLDFALVLFPSATMLSLLLFEVGADFGGRTTKGEKKTDAR